MNQPKLPEVLQEYCETECAAIAAERALTPKERAPTPGQLRPMNTYTLAEKYGFKDMLK
jgi:hypothetical protein